MLFKKVASLTLIAVLALALLPRASRAADTPAAEISDQVIQDHWVVVSKVVAAAPGWIVIHNGDKAAGFPAIGETYVPAGESDNVAVWIDMDKATPDMSAMLHVDKGTAGKYEFPGPDAPVMNGDKVVNTPFKVIGVDVDDQFISDKKTVTLGKVIAQEDGFVVIHAGSEGFPAIGNAPIKAGVNENVEVTIDPSKATDKMTAMIHIDAGQKGKYEFPGADVPASLGGAISNEPFWTVDHVRVQGMLLGSDNTVVVPYVLAKADGFMVIHSTAKDFPVIGHTPVKAGLNEGVKVKLTGKPTETVLAMLHVDEGKKGTYEFPGADVPVKDKAGNVIAPPMLVGNGVMVHDQTADDIKKSGMVVIDTVVAAKNGWLVVHSSAQGNPGIGVAYIHAGLNHNVMVKVKPEDVTDTLLAMLHVDLGTPGKYEFPGADVPVKDAAGNVIAPPIKTGAAAMSATMAATMSH
jgi:hypothetical protein